MSADLIKEIEAFLASPNHAKDSGWPDIQDRELMRFFGLVERMKEAKWGRDCDGDSPVTVVVWDRQKHFLPWSWPIRKEPSMDQLRSIIGALNSYTTQLEIAHKLISMEIHKDK